MLGEFDIIDRYFKRQIRRSDVISGIGDDAAVLKVPPGMELVVTMDTLVSGVHFPKQIDAEAIGFKALAVNLSDLASMGATPAWFTLSLTLAEVNEVWLEGFAHGLFELADRYDVDLIGGDMTHGGLSISITAMGFTPVSKALRRDGARPGDGIFVTGCVGDAGLGLAALNKERALHGSDLDYFLLRLNRPVPRVDAGQILLDRATAAIDISDGLAADLNHILIASDVGASIQLSSIPLSAAFVRACAGRPEWQIPLACGDDYELLFTLPQYRVQQIIREMASLSHGITQIGQIEERRGMRFWGNEGQQYIPESIGYRHFET
jgi:thiamine-monophosphate kinase